MHETHNHAPAAKRFRVFTSACAALVLAVVAVAVLHRPPEPTQADIAAPAAQAAPAPPTPLASGGLAADGTDSEPLALRAAVKPTPKAPTTAAAIATGREASTPEGVQVSAGTAAAAPASPPAGRNAAVTRRPPVQFSPAPDAGTAPAEEAIPLSELPRVAEEAPRPRAGHRELVFLQRAPRETPPVASGEEVAEPRTQGLDAGAVAPTGTQGGAAATPPAAEAGPPPTPESPATPEPELTPEPSPMPEPPPAPEAAPPADDAEPTPAGGEPAEEAEPVEPAPPAREFTFFNALLHRDMPAEVRSMEEFPRLRVFYGSEMWGPNQDESQPIERNFRRLAFQAKAQGLDLVCLDIEHWNLDSDNHEAVAANVDKFLQILAWMRDESPGLKIGFYGLVPNMTPDDARFDHDDPRQVEERDRNDRLQELTDAVDVLFPVMYTVVPPDQIGLWRRYVPAKIREARRIGNGKPVYVFVWYEYHDALVPELAGTPVEAGFWREQLDMIQADADGIVVWGGYKRSWDPDATWWTELRSRIQPQRSSSFD